MPPIAKPSRFVNFDFSGSAAVQFPTNGQGGATPTASLSQLFLAQNVEITGVMVSVPPLADLTVTFTNAAGTTDLFPMSIRTSTSADRCTPPNWEVPVNGGFGVKSSATDAQMRLTVFYRYIN